MTNEKIQEQLKSMGIDTGKYVSLKEEPLTAVANYDNTFKIISTGCENNGKHFAVNSIFYSDIMEDGNIFNPYIHRRWLPAHFIKNRRCGVRDYSLKPYGSDRLYRVVLKEIKTLALLSRIDKVAYEERKHFYTLDICKSILIQYIRLVEVRDKEIEIHYLGRDFYDTYFKRTVKYINEHHDYVEYCEEVINEIQNCGSYGILENLLKRYGFTEKLETKHLKPTISDEYEKAFMRAGAYYTLKHMIMFQGKRISELSKKESLDLLRECIDCDYETYNKMLLDMGL